MSQTTIIASVVVLSAEPAWAYLDGGTSAMITQLIIGGIAGIGAYVGFQVQSVRSFFSRLFGRVSAEEDAQADDFERRKTE